MSKRDRATLRGFFRDGALPSSEEYRDLIDSSVNQVDDGFEKTEEDGLRLYSMGGSRALMSLFRGLGATAPSWQLAHGASDGTLQFLAGAGPDEAAIGAEGGALDAETGQEDAAPKGMTLTRDGRVGVNTDAPDHALDVVGVARMEGRTGVTTEMSKPVYADGEWHDITVPMTGCQAFEVVAGAGGRVGAGRYALMHAVALNAYHPRNPVLNWLFARRNVRSQTAVYGSYADRLQLRWRTAPGQHSFKLQLRSNSSFGSGYRIQYSLTRLWFDPTMAGSREDVAGSFTGAS